MLKNNKKFYITTPIYYVNDKPHIGHAYTTLLGDVLAGYQRLLGNETYFLTGTDEHGQKVEKAAKERNCKPKEHADKYVKRFKQLCKTLTVKNDDFIRTTEPRHINIVKKVLTDLYKKGDIYKGSYNGWYCTPCEKFHTEKDLINLHCPDCHREVDEIIEENYFFAMSKYQDWLIQYINNNPDFIQPENRKNETLGFLQKKLGDLCISRPKKRLSWGIELPFDSDYVCYVWFDALVNYISAIGYKENTKHFKSCWPANYHLIGKDILTTHTVYWTTMLKAIGLDQPKTIFAHGWWLLNGGKISKSKGNAINPLDLIEKYGTDPFRYFLIAEMTIGQDANFSEERFMTRYNSDLANNFGNLANRVLKLIQSSCNGIVPSSNVTCIIDKELKENILHISSEIEPLIKDLRIDIIVSNIQKGFSLINKYLEKTEPWKLKKQINKKDRLNEVLGNAIEALRIISGLLYPIIPDKINELRTSIGLTEAKGSNNYKNLKIWGDSLKDKYLKEGKALFPRI